MKDFEEQLASLLASYGIPPDYFSSRAIPRQAEATELESIGPDIFGREQQLAPAAAQAWRAMQAAAEADGVALLVVSAFRSVQRQCALFERKLEAGQSCEEILRVSMAPGFSEHHTGRALDIATPGCPPLVEAFADTPAFQWLSQSAARFGFSLTYPRDNPYGVVYEPWHWAFTRA
ncbi:MAG TPA: M15 family metallopeptidase [Polyangia bacterium]